MAARKKTQDNNGVDHEVIAPRACISDPCGRAMSGGRELKRWLQAERQLLHEHTAQVADAKQRM